MHKSIRSGEMYLKALRELAYVVAMLPTIQKNQAVLKIAVRKVTSDWKKRNIMPI